MKKVLMAITLLLLCFPAFSQNSGPGYVVANDFSMPTPHTTFWLRTAIPAGSVPVFSLSGTNYTTVHTDTFNVPKLALRNDTTVYKLVQIGTDGMLRAFIPKYLVPSDTNNRWLSIGYVPNWNSITNKPNFLDSSTIYTVINNKLNISDTFGHWLPLGTFIPDTTEIYHRISLKLNINDTTGKWLSANTHIPTDQVNADWNSASGVSQILNKPPLVTSYHQLTDTLNITQTNINNWNTAFSWGNPSGVYTPLTRTITINGNTQDLSVNRTYNISADSSIFLTKYGNDTAKTRLTTAINGKLDFRYIPTNIDSSNTNELQTLSKSGNNLTLSNGGGTFSVADADSSITNEIQTISRTGTTVTLSNSGGSFTVADNDSVATNELQTLSISNRDISLSLGGGTVTVPQTVWDSVTNKPTTLAGYGITNAVANTRTLTINGSTQDLSANRTWSVGTVTSAGLATGSTGTDVNVSGSPITSSGNITLNIPTASATNRGVLSTTDWSTFNAKQPTITLTTTGTNGAATFSSNTLNIPIYVAAAPTYNNNVSHSLNSNFTISSTQRARVTYTVRISYSITVLLGSTGSIDLQYSTDGGSTWATVSTVSNNLNLGIALTGYNDFVLTGEIPINALVRLNSTTSNATNSYRTGQEVLQ